MLIARRGIAAGTALILGLSASFSFSQVTYEDGPDGVRYQKTTKVVQRTVPVTVMQDRQQTVYTQQITTNNINTQQLYTVPVTQYQWDSRLHGRWNPFVTPYWTHSLRPVTTWQQQMANVQIPVNSVSWAPQTRTVQIPVTEYRTAEETITTKVAVNGSRTLAGAQPLSGSTATIAARPSSVAIGGHQMQSDPPPKGTGWQSQTDSRYR